MKPRKFEKNYKPMIIIFVGDGNNGKTTIAKWINNMLIDCSNGECAADALEIIEWDSKNDLRRVSDIKREVESGFYFIINTNDLKSIPLSIRRRALIYSLDIIK